MRTGCSNALDLKVFRVVYFRNTLEVRPGPGDRVFSLHIRNPPCRARMATSTELGGPDVKDRGVKVWTAQQIAQRYRVTLKTAYQWLHDGLLEGTKNPETGRWEVTQAALANFKPPRRGPEPTPLIPVGDGSFDQPFLPLAAVAERYGVCYQTARTWAQRGYIPVIRLSPRGAWVAPCNMLLKLEKHAAQTSERTTHPTPEGGD